MLDTNAVVDRLVDALGADAVSTAASALEATSHDTWPVAMKWARQECHPYRGDVVVRCHSATEIAAVLRIAEPEAVPVTARALGSSVTGQPLPTHGGIVLDVSELEGEVSVDEVDLTVTVPAGYPGGRLEDELNTRGYTLGHSPQSLYRSSVGGWLATLATGQFSSLYGGIEDLVVGYEMVLASGEIVDLRARPRAAMGPDLRQLFLGSEGTLGVITSVTLQIFPIPQVRLLETFDFPTLSDGLAVLREQVSSGLRPFLVRLYDVDEARHALSSPFLDNPIMFTGTQGDPRMAETEMQVLREIAQRYGGRSRGPEGARAWMERRFDFSGVENRLATEGGYAETIEVAHTWRHIGKVHEEAKRVLAPMADEVLAHFSHVYPQGTSMYVILLGQTETDAEASARLEEIWTTMMQICLDHGAELSHHHGGGLARSPYVERSLGAAHNVLRRVKSALDPEDILNPGKLGL